MPEVDGGKTVRIILRRCETELSKSFIEWTTLRLCDYMGMTWVGDPVTRTILPGLSAVLVIEESHIAVHTWPESASVRVVIDSCVDFDHEATARWLKGIFEAAEYDCLSV